MAGTGSFFDHRAGVSAVPSSLSIVANIFPRDELAKMGFTYYGVGIPDGV